MNHKCSFTLTVFSREDNGSVVFLSPGFFPGALMQSRVAAVTVAFVLGKLLLVALVTPAPFFGMVDH